MSKFAVGDVMVCKYSDGYNITVGKQYTATLVQASEFSGSGCFTWPEYVDFIDDSGKSCRAHAARFDKVQP